MKSFLAFTQKNPKANPVNKIKTNQICNLLLFYNFNLSFSLIKEAELPWDKKYINNIWRVKTIKKKKIDILVRRVFCACKLIKLKVLF